MITITIEDKIAECLRAGEQWLEQRTVAIEEHFDAAEARGCLAFAESALRRGQRLIRLEERRQAAADRNFNTEGAESAERTFDMAVRPPPLHALTDAQRARVEHMLHEQDKSYGAIQRDLLQEFGVRVSFAALSEFYRVTAVERLEKAAKEAAAIATTVLRSAKKGGRRER